MYLIKYFLNIVLVLIFKAKFQQKYHLIMWVFNSIKFQLISQIKLINFNQLNSIQFQLGPQLVDLILGVNQITPKIRIYLLHILTTLLIYMMPLFFNLHGQVCFDILFFQKMNTIQINSGISSSTVESDQKIGQFLLGSILILIFCCNFDQLFFYLAVDVKQQFRANNIFEYLNFMLLITRNNIFQRINYQYHFQSTCFFVVLS
eukprot:TRINITY_DN27833_c0_g1_i2.p2 TRINITY_DN27833_c0_g1~~TRINITY_DN27833_c0_g1_i2.p2  ORF type:complete len:204 (+),score=-5.53 TRINITY_DN27833_c0_g1_i2:16-627(+)